MIDLVISNGRVLDPARDVDRVAHVLVDAGRIVDIVTEAAPQARRQIDATGLWVTPGLIDMHVHLRDPGDPQKETIATGTAAAIAGGFTTVAAMANTRPVNDNVDVTRDMIARAAKVGLARVLPIAAVTTELTSETLTDFAALRAAGAVAFSNDGHPITSAAVMRRALAEAKRVGAVVIAHEGHCLHGSAGAMHAGPVAERLGVAGIAGSEEIDMVARDCALAAEIGARLHIAHISMAEAVAAVRAARAHGAPVTAEATPHHCTLDAEAVARHWSLAKMNPPLRSAADVAAVRAGLADGTLGVIATDHAPHHTDDKPGGKDGMTTAAFGIVGLETAVPLVLALVRADVLTAAAAIRALTAGPADALGIDAGRLAPGSVADVTLIDPELAWTVDAGALRSRSRNTPFVGMTMRGKAVGVCLGGRVLAEELDGRMTA